MNGEPSLVKLSRDVHEKSATILATVESLGRVLVDADGIPPFNIYADGSVKENIAATLEVLGYVETVLERICSRTYTTPDEASVGINESNGIPATIHVTREELIEAGVIKQKP